MSGTVHNRLNEAREACPTNTRRLIGEGALLLDVREPGEVAAFAFDVPDVLTIPMSVLEQRWSEVPRDRDVVVVCEVGGCAASRPPTTCNSTATPGSATWAAALSSGPRKAFRSRASGSRQVPVQRVAVARPARPKPNRPAPAAVEP